MSKFVLPLLRPAGLSLVLLLGLSFTMAEALAGGSITAGQRLDPRAGAALRAVFPGIRVLTEHSQRALYFWSSSSSEWGSVNILGDAARERETLEHLDALDVGTLYGSYSDLPRDDPDRVAAWNLQLRDVGISSQLLLSGSDWVEEAHRETLLDLVQVRLLDFNAQVGPRARFDTLHLDIEPHILDAWDDGDEAARRELLESYLETLAEVRDLLDDAGAEEVSLEVDIPVWWDALPESLGGHGAVGWTSVAERDSWFNALIDLCDGITLMAFERDEAEILDGLAWELDRYGATARPALEVDIPETWEDSEDFLGALLAIEQASGQAVAIQSYRELREAGL